MADQSWPRESDGTVALEAAAKKAYEMQGTYVMPPWDELPALTRHAIKDSVLPIVWAALAALPDPRHDAWEEGHEACASRMTHGREPENPYPSGL